MDLAIAMIFYAKRAIYGFAQLYYQHVFGAYRFDLGLFLGVVAAQISFTVA